jgi:hypothetical protein
VLSLLNVVCRARRVPPVLAWLFLAASACAQQPSLPEAPEPQAAQTLQRHDVTTLQRHDTRAFAIFSAIEYAATFSDAALSASHIGPQKGCAESDPIYGGRFPARRRFFLQMGLQTTGVIALNYVLMRHGKHWWTFISAGDTMLHAGGIVQTLSCAGANSR